MSFHPASSTQLGLLVTAAFLHPLPNEGDASSPVATWNIWQAVKSHRGHHRCPRTPLWGTLWWRGGMSRPRPQPAAATLSPTSRRWRAQRCLRTLPFPLTLYKVKMWLWRTCYVSHPSRFMLLLFVFASFHFSLCILRSCFSPYFYNLLNYFKLIKWVHMYIY